MKAILLAAITIVAAMAGCFGGDPEPSPTPTTSPTGTSTGTSTSTPPPTSNPTDRFDLLLGFGMVDCKGLRIESPVSLATIQAAVPEPYVVMETEPGLGSVNVDLYRCSNFTTATSTLASTWFGHVYTPIEDPGLYPADHHEYTWQILADNDIIAQVWLVAGYSVANSTASMADIDPSATALFGARQGEAGGYNLTGTGAGPGDDSESTFARYTKTPSNSTIYWRGNTTASDGFVGPGSVIVPSSPAISLATQGRLIGMATASTTSFTEQDLTLVFGRS